MSATPLQSLADYGQSVWIDAPPRELLRGDRLERFIREHGITGVVADRWAPDEIASAQRACERLLAIWHATRGRDGYVSLDCHLRPRVRAEVAVARAKRLHRLVGRPNLLVRIPPTGEGLTAVEGAIAAGVSVDVAPIFSVHSRRAAFDAYMRGLQRLRDQGGDPAAVTSVASMPVRPVDAEVDRRLEQLGGEAAALRGRLALANARLAYHQYAETVGGRSWRELESLGARAQRCLWASTSPKRGTYAPVLYVEELIGADTISAVSPDTIAAFEDRGLVADRLGRRIEDAQAVVDDVRSAGVELDDVWRTLEAEGDR